MKKTWFAIILALAIALVLSGCGTKSSTSNSSNVTGNWTGSMTNTTGQTLFTFTMSLSQAASNTVTGTNLKFTSGAPCFENITSDGGTFTLSGNLNGQVTNELQLTVLGSETGQLDFNTLTMSGAVSGSSISGGWTLQGFAPGCAGFGNFSMSRTK